MKKDDMLWILAGIVVIAMVVRDPSSIGAFAKDIGRATSYVGTVGNVARESFRS